MCANRNISPVFNDSFLDNFDQIIHFPRCRVADRIGNIERRRALLQSD